MGEGRNIFRIAWLGVPLPADYYDQLIRFGRLKSQKSILATANTSKELLINSGVEAEMRPGCYSDARNCHVRSRKDAKVTLTAPNHGIAYPT